MIVEKYLFENDDVSTIPMSDKVVMDVTSGAITPDLEFVISRNSDGDILSRYKDDIWDLTVYSETSGRKLYFTNIKNKKVRNEVKRFMFILMVFSSGRGGTTKAPSTLRKYLQRLFVPLSQFVDKYNISMVEFFEDSNYMKKNVEFMKKESSYLSCLYTILILFKNLSNTSLGMKYILSKDLEKKISRYSINAKKQTKQTPVIPTSIFLSATAQRWEHLDRIEKSLPSLLSFMEKCLHNGDFARTKTNKYSGNRWKKYDGFVEWDKAVKQYGLSELFTHYEIRDRGKLYGTLSYFQGTCRHLIFTYTGMRHDETKSLRIDCFEEKNRNLPARIAGVTKKIHGVPVPQVWVTVSKIKNVINILKQINQVVIKNRIPNLKDEPLFLDMRYFHRPLNEKELPFGKVNAIGKDPSAELPLDEASLKITKKHIKEELNAIEPERRWEDEKEYRVGNTWHFTYHQYRRTLAVYALGSGLVSLNALRKQFGHLFHTMTAYYGNGSFAAKPIIGIEHGEHINQYMKHIKGEIDFLSYFKNVLFNVNTLFGAHGQFHTKHDEQINEHILQNRQETIKKFKKGLMFYKETAVGGCVSTTPCNEILFGSYTACFGCENGYQTKEKVMDTIKVQKSFLNELDPKSIEYRSEKEVLEILEKNYKRMKEKQ